jgi:uncharacterized protein YfaS (alpha-2-macroglobulin family)
VIQAVPEGGAFQPGLDNILYVMTSYPDGSPADAQVAVTFAETVKEISVQTGAYGIAELHVTPNSPYQQISIVARDARGTAVQKEFSFQGEWNGDAVLLRPDKPVYKVGETMNLTLLVSQPQGSAYLDIVRGGQTLSTRSLSIENGKAQAWVDLTPDLYGTLELHAYKILPGGTITRDTRLVVVDPASDLNVQLSSGQDSYKPGDQAALDFQVSTADGQPVQAALGIAVVDEAVLPWLRATPASPASISSSKTRSSPRATTCTA